MPKIDDFICSEINLPSIILTGLKGSIKGYSFRIRNGVSYYMRKPIPTNPRTKKQQDNRNKFAAAVKYAQEVLKNPFLKDFYKRRLKHNKAYRVYDLAIKDCLNNKTIINKYLNRVLKQSKAIVHSTLTIVDEVKKQVEIDNNNNNIVERKEGKWALTG